MKVTFKTPGSFRVCFDRVVHVGEDAVDKTVYDIPAEAGVLFIGAGKASNATESPVVTPPDASKELDSEDVGSDDLDVETKTESIDSTAKKSKGFFGNK